MNFNERLIELRKSKSLTQDELGEQLGVSRQTISKWELAQSYPDFQRLVLLSDFFGLTLDELVKGINIQDVRNKNLTESQITKIYDEVNSAKFIVTTVIKGFAIIGIIGIVIFLLMGILLG